MTSRTAAWNNNGALATAGAMATTATLDWSAPVANKIASTKVTAGSEVSNADSSPCVACIAGGGVWCSRTYSYSFTGNGSYQAGKTAFADFFNANYPTTLALATAGTADNGACCSANYADIAAYAVSAGSGVIDKQSATATSPLGLTE